jgi:hypothetical protein
MIIAQNYHLDFRGLDELLNEKARLGGGDLDDLPRFQRKSEGALEWSFRGVPLHVDRHEPAARYKIY